MQNYESNVMEFPPSNVCKGEIVVLVNRKIDSILTKICVREWRRKAAEISDTRVFKVTHSHNIL